MRFSDRTSNWIAGFGFGAFMGVLLVILPTLAVLLILAFAVPILRRPARLAAVGGLLVGLPALWLILVVRAELACREFDAAPGQGCIGPDLSAWYLVAGTLLMVGIVLSWRELRRPS